MRVRLVLACLGALLIAGVAAAVVRATQSQTRASWQWRVAALTHAPRQLVSSSHVTLFAAAGASGMRLLVEADGRFVQTVRSQATNDVPVAAFVVANDSTTETVVGVVRNDVSRIVLRGANGAEHDLAPNELGAFVASSIDAGTSWQLDALASDGSLLTHLSLPQVAAPCGGPLGPCRTTAANPHDSSYPASPLKTVASAHAAGKRWKLQTYFNRTGKSCVQLVGGGGEARTCMASSAPITTFRPIWGGVNHSDGPTVWIFGKVAPSVRHVMLVRDCGGEVFDLSAGPQTQRWFLRVLAPVELKKGGAPRELVMRDASGVIVSDQHISASPLLGGAIPAPAPGCSERKTASALSIARRAARRTSVSATTASTKGYTISNRGTAVPARGNPPRLFPNHSYQLFLLGKTGDRAYYRVQVTAHFTCWGSGSTNTIGKLGELGCPGLVGAYPLQLDNTAIAFKPGKITGIHQTNNPPHYLRIAGVVVDQAATVALETTAGRVLKRVIPHNNLFSFTGPFPRQFLRVVPLDEQGAPLKPHPDWGQHQTPPPDLWGPTAVKANPQTLGTVVQRGSAKGVTVSASQKGVVVFDLRALEPTAHAILARGSVWFSCFQISGQNVRHYRDVGISSRLSSVVAFKSRGVKPHYDGCEAGGDYGHRWHDRYGPHSTIEIPLTAQGARYFEDRATARDLAEFVRSAKMHAIRKLTGSALLAAIRNAYGNQIAVMQFATAPANPGQVGVWVSGRETIFSERSHLGDRLYVEIEQGKITNTNVRGLAFVF